MSVLFLSPLEYPMRGRVFREPDDAHVAIASGSDLSVALEHLAARPDCTGLALLGVPKTVPELEALAGRRLLVCESDGGRMRDFVAAAWKAGAEAEWINRSQPTRDRLAAWALPVAGLVLAAGSGTRMSKGEPNKLLLDYEGVPLVRYAVGAAADGGCQGIWAVYSQPDVLAVLEGLATCIHNPDAASGQASSLRVGIENLPVTAAGVVILLGDQPLVGGRTVEMLLRAWRAGEAKPAVAASYGGEWRPPVVIDRSLWPSLLALKGDAGARQVLGDHPELLDTVPAAGLPDDIDTPEDYARILRLPKRDPG
ncbi:MAG: nucleotidyltransferase family protein [Candidatus Dormibacteraeota bacterium]|nr:nucleotidyltransferase family protein [Candidatus Dormibacteraeota bacterium]